MKNIPPLMNPGRVVPESFSRSIQHRQRFIFHFNQRKSLPGNLFVIDRHQSYRVAPILNPVPAENRPVGGDDPETAMPGNILVGENGMDTGQFPSPFYIQPDDRSMGMGTPQRLANQHPGKIAVGRKDRLPGHLISGINPGCSPADISVGISC